MLLSGTNMTNFLSLNLLGTPKALLNDNQLVNFVSRKTEATLYYLAVTGQTHARTHLAALFWPEDDEKTSRKNMRDVIFHLKKMVGDHLLITRTTVAFNVDAPYALDVDLLKTAVSSPVSTSTTATPDPQTITRAVAAYRNDFLTGFYVDDAPEFDNWIVAQSTHWRGLFIQGLNLLAEHYLQQHQYTEGLAVTARLLDVEPWSERAYQQRMLLFAYNGQRSDALKTYRQCRQTLDEAFNIPPMIETTALYNRIRTEETDGSEAAIPLHNLPREFTPFIGREAELQALRTKVLDPLYPLITIIGEGGVGKSRLAMKGAVQLLYDFPDGVWFVPLMGIKVTDEVTENETALALAVSKALQLHLQPNAPVIEQVITHVQKKELLLVMDNMEHLVDGACFIVRLLREAKKVHLIVTSRRRLDLQMESVFRLHGLPVPDENTDKSDSLAYTSVELFNERAHRAEPNFAVTATNAEAIGDICRLVDGLPLGIELAAALVEQQSCASIATHIEKGIEILAATMRDLPAHHRTIWALFEYSWQLLTKENQLLLAHCSVFAGGFMFDAAVAVTNAAQAGLTDLIDQSLLKQDENGRFQFHPLLHQFSQKKLKAMGEEMETAVSTRHYTHYLGWAEAHKNKLFSLPLPALQLELSNTSQAWQAAAKAEDFAFLATIIDGWIIYARPFSLRIGWLRMITDTIEKFEQSIPSPSPQTEEIRGALTVCHLYALNTVTQYPEMSAIADDLLSFASTPTLKTYAHYLKAITVRCLYGDQEEAVEHLSYSLKHAHLLPVPMRIGLFGELGIMMLRQGRDDESLAYFEQALAVAKSENQSRMIYYLSLNLGNFYAERKKYHQAIICYEDADTDFSDGATVRKSHSLLDRWATAYVETGQYDNAENCLKRVDQIGQDFLPPMNQATSAVTHARLYVRMRHYEKGLPLAETAVCLFQELGQKQWLAYAWDAQGRVLLGLTQWEAAIESFETAMAMWEEMGIIEGALGALTGLTVIALAQEDVAEIKKRGDELARTIPRVSIYHEVVEDWAWSYLICYEALTAVNNLLAADILQTAHELLMEQAERIEKTAVCQQFMNIPTHREIVRLMGEG